MTDLKQKATEATDFVVGKVDEAVDSMGDMLTGEKGRKLAGGAAIGALAAVVLPVSLVGGAAIGAGYVALRQFSKRKPAEDTPKID